MFGLTISPRIIIAAVIAVVIGGGGFYIHTLRADVASLQAEVGAANENAKTARAAYDAVVRQNAEFAKAAARQKTSIATIQADIANCRREVSQIKTALADFHRQTADDEKAAARAQAAAQKTISELTRERDAIANALPPSNASDNDTDAILTRCEGARQLLITGAPR